MRTSPERNPVVETPREVVSRMYFDCLEDSDKQPHPHLRMRIGYKERSRIAKDTNRKKMSSKKNRAKGCAKT